MNRILTTGIALCFLAACFAQPMVVQEWFRTVEGGSHRNDVAHRIAIGPDGSPVIAGDRTVVGRYTEPQMTVMKFSKEGDLLWNRYVSYGSGWSGDFVSMVIDQEGHPIITGNLPFVPEVRSNGALIEKLDPATGVPIWATLYVNPRGLDGDEKARFLAIARNGDVLFSGQSHIDRDWMDLLALRLDREDGRIKWLSHYAPFYNSTTNSVAIGELPNGEVFTANQNSLGVGEQDPLAIWHDGQTGEIQRLYLYDTGCTDAFGGRLAIDAQGNAYTGGMGCYQDDDGEWYWADMVWKWSPTGELVWTRGLDFGPGGLAGNFLLDGSGALLVMRALQDNEGRWATALVKINTATSRIMRVTNLPPHSDLRRMAMDANGDLYLAGLTTNAPVGPSPQDGLVVKVRGTDGQIVWMKNFHHGSEYGGADNFYDIALDSQGNVYACGSASVSGNWHDFLLVKYRQPIRGDVNLDGCVDDRDLALQLEAYGAFDERYDSNGDGFVDMADVLLLLDHFGQGCE